MLIRDMTPADLAPATAINAANVPDVGPADHEHLGFLVGESRIALVVEAEGSVVGFCLVLGPGSTYDSVNYRWFMERYDDVLYLDRVAVDAGFRGVGIGQALYADVFDRMASAHPSAAALTLEVNVDPPNEPSLRFHHRQGFVEVGRQMSKGIEVSLMHRPVSV